MAMEFNEDLFQEGMRGLAAFVAGEQIRALHILLTGELHCKG